MKLENTTLKALFPEPQLPTFSISAVSGATGATNIFPTSCFRCHQRLHLEWHQNFVKKIHTVVFFNRFLSFFFRFFLFRFLFVPFLFVPFFSFLLFFCFRSLSPILRCDPGSVWLVSSGLTILSKSRNFLPKDTQGKVNTVYWPLNEHAKGPHTKNATINLQLFNKKEGRKINEKEQQQQLQSSVGAELKKSKSDGHFWSRDACSDPHCFLDINFGTKSHKKIVRYGTVRFVRCRYSTIGTDWWCRYCTVRTV